VKQNELDNLMHSLGEDEESDSADEKEKEKVILKR